MATFSQIQKGKRARKAIPFPLINTRCELLADLPELKEQRARDREAWEKAAQAGQAPPLAPDDHILVDARVLSGTEESLILEKAREHAIAHGVADPKDGDPLYEVGRMVWSLALGIVDHDASFDDPDPPPFFDGGAKQILDELDGDRIAFLYARWDQWQGECSPYMNKLSGPQYWEHLVKVVVSDDDLPFSQMSRTTQRILLRTTGALLLNSPEAKSLFTSAFADKPKEPEPKIPTAKSRRSSGKKG